MSDIVFPKRTVHLDFHTGPAVPGVGDLFDPEQFARTFKEAHIDSVTVFGTCHHGHAYWNTDRSERHPGMKDGFGLLDEQIKALHAVGIRAPIYLSVQCNEFCANEHPEWIALTPELAQVKRGTGPFSAGWQILDMSSPYQDYLAGQLAEVLERFSPVDGVFMDMCWDQPSCSKWAIAGMKKKRYDPRAPGDRAKYARELVHGYMKRFRDMVDLAQGNVTPAGVWFNSRPKTNLHVEKKFLRHIEIEALPTGGWGYTYFPYVARFVRPLGLPTLSHTGRFFKSWGDNGNLKPKAALKYECCQILSQGMTNGVGDLLPPTGKPSPAVYNLIGDVYEYIESCERYVDGATHVSQIGLVVDPTLGDKPGPSGVGATRALQQLRQQFDVIPSTADFSKYDVLIVLETTVIDENLRDALRGYLQNGGSLILGGSKSVDTNEKPVLEEQGIEVSGPSPFSHTFLHAEPGADRDIEDYGFVMYEPGYRMKPIAGAQSLVRVGEPYFERSYDRFSGHSYTPEAGLSEYSAVVQNGRVITFSVPIFEAYGKHASPVYRRIIGNCIDRLLPEPVIRDNGPTSLETTVVRSGNRTIIHLMSFVAERRADGLDVVEEAFPIIDLHISVKTSSEPRRVYLAPGETDLEFSFVDGYVETTFSVLDGHRMLIIERE